MELYSANAAKTVTRDVIFKKRSQTRPQYSTFMQ